MKQRSAQLARIARVRALEERVREAAVGRASAQVRLVQMAMDETLSRKRAAMEAGRAALLLGDCGDWQLAEATGELAGWDRSRLLTLQTQRAAELALAEESFREGRLRRKRADRLHDAARVALEAEEARAEQSRSDDRFAARQHWSARNAAAGKDLLMEGPISHL